MFNKNRASASGLFLIELIIAILVFSLSAAACLQIFVKSHTINNQSRTLSHSVRRCASVAEICRVSSSQRQARQDISAIYPHTTQQDGNLKIYFDSDFANCREPGGGYVIDVEFSTSAESHVLYADIKAEMAGETIHSLLCTSQIPRRTGHGQE